MPVGRVSATSQRVQSCDIAAEAGNNDASAGIVDFLSQAFVQGPL